MQVGEHLTAVTYAQCEGVITLEEGFELTTSLFVKQNRFRPTFTGTQYVAVREAAARHKTTEAFKRYAARQDVAHVYVNSGETSAVEGRSHFDLTVNALLTQNRYQRTLVAQIRCNIFINIEGQFSVDTRIFCIEQSIKFLLRAVGVITQCLHFVAGLCPQALPGHAAFAEEFFVLEAEGNLVVVIQRTDHLSAVPQTRRFKLCQYFFQIVTFYLHDCT